MKILIIQDHYIHMNWEENIIKIGSKIKEAQDKQVDLVLLPVGAILGLECSGFANKLSKQDLLMHSRALHELAAMAGGDIHILLGDIRQRYELRAYHYNPDHQGWQVLDIHNPYFKIGDHLIAAFAQISSRERNPNVVLDFMPKSYVQRRYHVEKLTEFRNYIQIQPLGTIGTEIYPGGSCVYDSLGQLIFQAPICEEIAWVYDLELNYPKQVLINCPPIRYPKLELNIRDLELLFKVLCFGLQDFIAKTNSDHVVIGLSGGMDSALCLALAIKGLGRDRVRTVYLPSMFSSESSTKDTNELARICGVEHLVLPINQLYRQVMTTIEQPFANLGFSVAEENIQSRLRGLLLMALANKFNYILLNTSNKSELCMGYGTLYGDLCGGLGLLGDLYKTQVYSLAHYINENVEFLIPDSVFSKAPSAELRPNQKDSDSLPEYTKLDPILFAIIEQSQDLIELQAQGIDLNLLEFIWQRIQNNQYKLKQVCPILQVSMSPLSSKLGF